MVVVVVVLSHRSSLCCGRGLRCGGGGDRGRGSESRFGSGSTTEVVDFLERRFKLRRVCACEHAASA